MDIVLPPYYFLLIYFFLYLCALVYAFAMNPSSASQSVVRPPVVR